MTPDYQNMLDEELVERFRQPETREKAYSHIVKRHQERLYWHIRRMVIHHEDTNDVLQNVFVKVWKGLDNFRGESSLFTWLYRIATNETYTYLEKMKKRRAISISDHESHIGNLIKAEKGFDYNKLEWKLQLAIQSLPEKQKIVFNLRYYDEMPYDKMSEVLDTSVGALKASYHFAVKKVEEFLKNELNHDKNS